jgi:hypothetical protein
MPLNHEEQTQLDQITTASDQSEGVSFAVLVYGGAAGITTHMQGYLHGYKVLTSQKVFYDAGKRAHTSAGEGYMKLLWGSDTSSANMHISIHC